MTTPQDRGFAEAAESAAAQGRKIQDDVDSRPGPSGDGGQPMQAGTRPYPAAFPPQHVAKPGGEAELALAPMYEAPGYRGSGKLDGMVALITGGDSGIGRAVAVLYAREGANVVIVYLNEHDDAAATCRLVEAGGRRCVSLAGDVAEPAFCAAAIERCVSEFGGLDILVNNAAFQQHVQSIEDLSEAQFDRTLKTNLYGYFHMAKAAVARLRAGGSIIMTGSVTGIEGSKNLLDYSMTKGGIHAFARSLSAHLIDRGIRVNVVAPGPVWTPLNPADRDGAEVATFGSDTAMKRAAQPEEIAPAYVFLAAPSCASYITGEILPIVGGYT